MWIKLWIVDNPVLIITIKPVLRDWLPAIVGQLFSQGLHARGRGVVFKGMTFGFPILSFTGFLTIRNFLFFMGFLKSIKQNAPESACCKWKESEWVAEILRALQFFCFMMQWQRKNTLPESHEHPSVYFANFFIGVSHDESIQTKTARV